MNIKFSKLTESHFPLLLKWLESPHVKQWWDQDVRYTPELIKEKFADCVKGYRFITSDTNSNQLIKKPINAYIIFVDEKPVGYIQIYKYSDFSDTQLFGWLPMNLAAFDIFIGEADYLGSGIGSRAIVLFLEQYAGSYTYVFADPNIANTAAIRAYEKAGFVKLTEAVDVVLMLKCKQSVRLPINDRLAIENIFYKYFLDEDSLWIFGSRVNLDKKGGNIDIYIETSIKDHAEALERKLAFLCDLKERIGDQKIDVVLNIKDLDHNLPIYGVARSEGVKIV